MIHLVEVSVVETIYQEGAKEYTKTHLVEADSCEEVERKIQKHYSDMDSAYYKEYSVYINSIEKPL